MYIKMTVFCFSSLQHDSSRRVRRHHHKSWLNLLPFYLAVIIETRVFEILLVVFVVIVFIVVCLCVCMFANAKHRYTRTTKHDTERIDTLALSWIQTSKIARCRHFLSGRTPSKSYSKRSIDRPSESEILLIEEYCYLQLYRHHLKQRRRYIPLLIATLCDDVFIKYGMKSSWNWSVALLIVAGVLLLLLFCWCCMFVCINNES